MSDDVHASILTQQLTLGTRAVGVLIGCAAITFPFIQGAGLDLSVGGVKLLFMLAFIVLGIGVIALFVLAPSTFLAANGSGLLLRQEGVLGRKTEELPLSAVENVKVGETYTSAQGSRYFVTVKLKGRRRVFMGESHEERADAEAECAVFCKAAGMA